jgi:hypothetical protein
VILVCPFPTLITILILLAASAKSSELFRYRGAARDGGTLEYVFDSDEVDVPKTATKEGVAEIAADFMTTFYDVQVGALETQEFRQQPIPFWLLSFSDTVKGPMHQLFLCRRPAKRERG